MAIKFGTDGTLYCNTVKYNYKQTRNIVQDNCGSYQHWTGGVAPVQYIVGNDNSKYKLYFPKRSGLVMYNTAMPVPKANHKYYGGCMWYTESGFSAGDARFEWYNIDGDTNVNLIFAQRNGLSTNGNWIIISDIVQAGASPVQENWQIRNFVYDGASDAYSTKHIIIDLTDTFGAGNEPSKEWCDQNILEWQKITGYGIMNELTNSNITQAYNSANSSGFQYFSAYDYGTMTPIVVSGRTDLPVDPLMDIQSSLDQVSAAFWCNPNIVNILNTTDNYYIFCDMGERTLELTGTNYQLTVGTNNGPVIPYVNNSQFNSGGDMVFFKRLSRTGYPNEATQWLTIWYNNFNTSVWTLGLLPQIVKIQDVLTRYNSLYTTNQTQDNTNTEWCDRWIDGQANSIIHILTHNNNDTKFMPDYTIKTNNIDILNNVNKVTIKNGVVKCKKLVRQQSY